MEETPAPPFDKTGPLPVPVARASASVPAPAALAFHERGYQILARLLHGLFAHNAFEAAASIAFWFFLSLVPLLVFIGWLLGHIVRSDGIDALVQPALAVAPASAEQLLRSELGRMAQGTTTPIAPLSVLGFLWTSSSGLHNLMDVFELAVKVPRRPWWKQRSIALGCVVLGLIASSAFGWALVRIEISIHSLDVAVAEDRAAEARPETPREVAPAETPPLRGPAAREPRPAPANPANPAGASAARDGRDPRDTPAPRGTATQRASRHVREQVSRIMHSPWEKGVAAMAAFLVGVTFLAGFYRFAVEHPTGVKRHAFPGAVAAALSWLAVSWGFGTYVSSLGNYAVYYGSVAGVAVLLIWLYLTSLTLVIGAEVNAQLEGIRA